MILGGKEVSDILSIKDFKQIGGYEVYVQTVYDGDTLHGIYFNNKVGRFITDKFRLARINAAEMKKERGKVETESEKLARLEKAIKATNMLINLIGGKEIYIECNKLDPYQRMISEIFIKLDNLSRNIVADSDCIVEKNGSRYLNISSYLLKHKIVEPYLGG